MSPSSLAFPSTFRWGTATSSYQVEGGLTNNDWHYAEQLGGFVFENQRAGQACDWWNRAEEDFDRMAAMGQNTHRLSIEWSRVEPEPGHFDEEALHRYREMLKGLLARGITPMVTLHHFTNPMWLAEKGGWENEAVIVHFRRYTRRVLRALGDLTPLWCTVNEPEVMIGQTYTLGRWWPAKKDIHAALHAGVHVVQAHAAAYHTIHEMVPGAQVGMAKHMMTWQPWRRWMPNDHLATRVVAHLFHDLPIGMMTEGIMRVPGQRSIVLPGCANTLDWLGVNYYQRYRVAFFLYRLLGLSQGQLPFEQRTHPKAFKGPGGWGEIHPRGLFDTLRSLWRRYRLPMYITENGIPDETDQHRPSFIIRHLRETWRAMQAGIPLLGYYFWSLVDNFEWTEGYDPRFRFGLIGVDFETQARTMRESGHLYEAICKTGGLTPQIVERFTPALLPELYPQAF